MADAVIRILDQSVAAAFHTGDQILLFAHSHIEILLGNKLIIL